MEAREFTGDLAAFAVLETVILGCSPDSTESHRRFRAKHELAVTLLADPDRAVMGRYGAWGPKTVEGKETVGVTRSTVLIDPHGVVAHHWPAVRPAGHAAEVRARLVELRGAAGSHDA